ncbi:MAG: phage major capsid protein [Candidatus Micrarchaeia archaeon]
MLGKKYIYVKEIACIVQIPQAYLDDADYDAWVEIKSAIEEGFGQVVDQAILFGTNTPFIAYL